MDRCDCCKCAMKHKRITNALFVCDDCRAWGMKQLGVTATALHVGIKA